MRCRRCGSAISPCAWPATASASWARSPTPLTRSSPPTSAWPSSSSGSARWSAAKARPASACGFGLSDGAWGEMEASVNSLIDDLLWPTTEVTRAIAAVAQGRPFADRQPRRRRPAAEGRVPALRRDRQHDDQAAQRVHLGGDARRARSRHRRQARRPGAGRRRHRRVEGPHRERQLDGVEPHRAGPQHRRSDDRGGQRRLVEKDHRRRARRNSAAQGSHQYDGGSAALVRLGSDARGARGRHRRQARRPGHRAGRRRHLEGFDRLGERHVRQPHRPGAQHRPCDHRRGARRPVAQNHGRRARRNSRAQRHHQYDGGSAQRLRLGSHPRRPRGRHRRQARRPGAGAGRRRHLEGLDRQRQLHGRQSDRAGAQHRRRRHRHRRRRPVEEDHGQRLAAKSCSSKRPSTRWSISSTPLPAK